MGNLKCEGNYYIVVYLKEQWLLEAAILHKYINITSPTVRHLLPNQTQSVSRCINGHLHKLIGKKIYE